MKDSKSSKLESIQNKSTGELQPADISYLKENQPILKPEQKWLSDAVDKGMRAVETIFEGTSTVHNGRTLQRSNISDEDVNFVLELVQETGLDRESLRAQILATKLGDYFIAQKKAFFMTADFKVQEASAYVNRLEKAVLSALKREESWKDQCIGLELNQRRMRQELEHLQREVSKANRPGLFKRLKSFLRLSK